MKSINTFLTERQFLNRLEQLPNSKTYLLDKCDESGVYVYNIKDDRFWLGKYALIGRSYGLLSTRLNCKYKVTQSGRVDVSFCRAKHPFHAILHFLLLAVGIYFCADSLISVFRQSKISDLLIALGFLAIGIYGLIIKPNKEWSYLEEYLYKICNIK